jgi:uncharacterized protein
MIKRIEKDFSDYFAKLYPESAPPIAYNEDGTIKTRMATKNITIVVTEDCCLRCSYCEPKDTPILMSNWQEKAIQDIQIGDMIIGFDEERTSPGKFRKIHAAKVTNVFKREAEIWELSCANGKILRITGNHPILTKRHPEWKKVERLTTKSGCVVIPLLEYPDITKEFQIDYDSSSYKIGYLTGLISGDGSNKSYLRANSTTCYQYKFRIAVKDEEIIQRAYAFLQDEKINCYTKPFKISEKDNLFTSAIFSNTQKTFEDIQNLLNENLGKNNSQDYLAGFLSGIYDAEGSIQERCIRITNTDTDIIEEIIRACQYFHINFVKEEAGSTKNFENRWNIRIQGSHSYDSFSFIKITKPATTRKGIDNFIEYSALEKREITSIRNTHEIETVYNIETTTGTYIANGFCVHNCYQHNKRPVYMTKETAHKIVDFLFQKDAENNPLINPIDANCLILDFIGGEPLMAIDVIDEFMKYFRRKAIILNHRWQNNYMISISTNGILYNTPEVKEFIRKNKERLSLTITIDGNKELHDSCRLFPDGAPSYDIVEASIKEYQKINPYLSTKLTLAPANIAHTFSAVKHLYENLHLNDVYMNCVYEEGWTYEEAKVLYEQLILLADWMIDNDVYQEHACSMFEENIGSPIDPSENNTYCGGCGSMLSFTADGHIQPCLRYTHFNLNDKQPELLLGTLDRGLVEAEEDKTTICWLNKITRRMQSTDECFYCPIGRGCGTCSAYDYERNGTPETRVTFICPMHKARVLANCYFWNKVYRKEGLPQRFAYHVPDEWALNIISQEEIHKLKNLAI